MQKKEEDKFREGIILLKKERISKCRIKIYYKKASKVDNIVFKPFFWKLHTNCMNFKRGLKNA